jgi:hypothetical protein
MFQHDSQDICINHYRFQSIEYLCGIKEQRGGGVKKHKYMSLSNHKAFLYKTNSHIEDLWLKDNSSVTIKNCYQRNDPSPKTDIYLNSSWSKKHSDIMSLENQNF